MHLGQLQSTRAKESVLMDITLGSLFCGIGGFPLAASWAGIETLWSNEIDKKCIRVLKKRFKHEIIEKDINDLDGYQLQRPDIITGGFPCQPFSVAGWQRGEYDNRYLWPQMLRIISELKPAYVVCENVFGLYTMDTGSTIEGILSSLEYIGYTVQPLIIPAASIGAQTERKRIWVIAYRNEISSGKPYENVRDETFRDSIEISKAWQQFPSIFPNGLPNVFRYFADDPRQTAKNITGIYRGNDGVPSWLDRYQQLGNSIYPPLAYIIFLAIKEHAKTRLSRKTI